MDAKECYEEPIEEGYRVYRVGGVEPLEKDKRGHNRRCCECNVVNRVNAISPEIN